MIFGNGNVGGLVAGTISRSDIESASGGIDRRLFGVLSRYSRPGVLRNNC
jgi:hypothetical protein